MIRTEMKRFVMLAGETHSAAICGEPLDVVPGAHYCLRVERALPGECETAMIGRDSLLKPDAADEVVAQESPVRVQVTAGKGKRVGVSRVVLEPVGPRLRIQNLRSNYAFVPPGEPFRILCDIRNTGSEAVTKGIARLHTALHELLEEHKQEQPLPPIELEKSVEVSWLVAKQRRAMARYEIEVEYEGGLLHVEGATLKHVPRLPPKRVLSSVAAGGRWFTVASRGLRATGHETDLDFGPLLISEDFQRVSLGVLHQIAQISPLDGPALPLWSRVRRVRPSGVELAGRAREAEWTILVSPDHRERGVRFEVTIRPKARIGKANLEFGPFQTQNSMRVEGNTIHVGTRKGETSLEWVWDKRHGFTVDASERSGMMTVRSKPLTFLPGMVLKLGVLLRRHGSSLAGT